MNFRTSTKNPVSLAIEDWEDQNRLERDFLSRLDWESLERCQVRKSLIMVNLDGIFTDRLWEKWFSSESSRRSIRQRVQKLVVETKEMLESIEALRLSLETQRFESEKSLRIIHRVKSAYGQSSEPSGWNHTS